MKNLSKSSIVLLLLIVACAGVTLYLMQRVNSSLSYVSEVQQEAAALKAQQSIQKNSKDEFPAIKLNGKSRQQEAIDKLGARLPEVAHWYGFTETEFKEKLKKDKTLWLDENARLLYMDEYHAEPQSATTATGTIGVQPFGIVYPLEDTFKLHSKPDSKRVIYLDFNGRLISGTAWNSYLNAGNDIIAPVWGLDGDPTTFSQAERERIQGIWQRVVEDYAAFDVDITTEEPAPDRIARTSTGDEYYGTVALISPVSSLWGNIGGSAYYGGFDYVNNTYYQPAVIVSDKVGNYSDKSVAEVISHEVGHNLWLDHDGLTDGTVYYAGNTTWAPIMGVSYSKTITTWSKGEYAGANNFQDDIAIIASKGIPVRPDDCGNTRTNPCSMFQTNSNVSASGIIERASDTDVYRFMSDAGPVSITTKFPPSASNLRARVTLTDDSGAVLATSPDTYTATTLTATVPGGTYYVSVQGVGATDHTAYASIGQYQIVGTVMYSSKLPPAASASASPLTGSAPLSVQFSSAGSNDPDGTITNYEWQFGDGTKSNEPDPTKVYGTSSTYTATLKVTDNDGFSHNNSVTVSVVNTPPVAVIKATPLSGNIPLAISFDGSASYDPDGAVTSYSWAFGDGTSGTGPTISHTYQSSGSFTAQLTVSDKDGKTSVATQNIGAIDQNTISAPSNVSLRQSNGTVTVTWSDNSPNETQFEVYRWLEQRKATPNYILVGSTAPNTTTFTQAVTSGSYYYYVEAKNATTGRSAKSAPIKIRVR